MKFRGKKIELGDFQTPSGLARQIVATARAKSTQIRSVVEPTCGAGSVLAAAIDAFPEAEHILGVEIQAEHLTATRRALGGHARSSVVRLEQGDFFRLPWDEWIKELPDPILIVGNPPWVTIAELGAVSSRNLPIKQNVDAESGMAARTGKSNFDLCEAIIRRCMTMLNGRLGVLAMLCKQSVARRALTFAWKNSHAMSNIEVRSIDALSEFAASVDACLLVCTYGKGKQTRRAQVFADLNSRKKSTVWQWSNSYLLADAQSFHRARHLERRHSDDLIPPRQWRSGIKHDCARVMELTASGSGWLNGLGHVVELEEHLAYPLLKGSDLMGKRAAVPRRLIVTQTKLGEDTLGLRATAPRAWKYLNRHAKLLNGRKSSIYQGRPRFSIFGVGPYAFSPWKVAISGMHKELKFHFVGPVDGRPTMLDDTCYFLPCRSKKDAQTLVSRLSGPLVRDFFNGLVFWDQKRPITAEILNRLDLDRLASSQPVEGPGAGRR